MTTMAIQTRAITLILESTLLAPYAETDMTVTVPGDCETYPGLANNLHPQLMTHMRDGTRPHLTP